MKFITSIPINTKSFQLKALTHLVLYVWIHPTLQNFPNSTIMSIESRSMKSSPGVLQRNKQRPVKQAGTSTSCLVYYSTQVKCEAQILIILELSTQTLDLIFCSQSQDGVYCVSITVLASTANLEFGQFLMYTLMHLALHT